MFRYGDFHDENSRKILHLVADFLICGLQYSKRVNGEELRSIIKKVLLKAENVKSLLSVQSSPSIPIVSGDKIEEDELKNQLTDFPQFEAALVLKKYAENLLSRLVI